MPKSTRTAKTFPQEMAANTLVECNIPFNHLPKKLIDIVNKFTEQLVKVELKEVEVSGWEELTSEIPMDEEGSKMPNLYFGVLKRVKNGQKTH